MHLTQLFILATSVLSATVISGSLPRRPSIRATSYNAIFGRQVVPSSTLVTQRATTTSISSSTTSISTPIPTLQPSANATTNSSSTAESKPAPEKKTFKPAQIAGIVLGVLGGIGSFLGGCLACCEGCGSCCDCGCCSGCCDCDCTCWTCDCCVCGGGVCGGQSYKEWCCSCRGIMVWSQAICDCINDWGRCCYRHEGNGGLDRNRERGEKRQGRILEKGKKEGGNVSVNGNLESSGGVIDGSRKEKKEEITEDERLRREDAEADRRMKAVFGPDAIYRQGDGYLGYQKMPRPTIVKELEIFATHEITSQPRKTEDMRVRVNDDVIKDIIGVQQAKADPIINTEDKASPVAKGSPFRMSFKDHEARRKQV